MKNRQYWKERFEILQESQMAKGEEYYRELDKQYRKAINEIESQMARWYGRIAENNEINMSQARKWLKGKELEEFKWTVEEYMQHGKQNAINPIWLKELENASARAHISRLEALKIQLQQTVESLYQSQNIGLSDALRRIYEDGYYHSAFEIQRGLNVGWSIPALDSARVTQMLSKPWTADGSNFSDRIWKAKGDLVNTLHTELTQSIIMGRAPDKAIKRIAEKFNTSRTRAGRLVMTESAFFASISQRDCFNDLDVERYEICATLDTKTSEICQGLDGKVFKMSEYEPGLTAPPFHCWCRTCTVPYFDDNFGERIARGEDGRQYYISDDIKYNDWKREYVLPESIFQKDIKVFNSAGAAAKKIYVKSPIDDIKGTEYSIKQGTYITNVEIIAGKDVKRQIDDIKRLINEHPKQNGSKTLANEWQKVKGIAIIDIQGGKKAEVHWYQCKEVGKVEFKIKRWLNEG